MAQVEFTMPATVALPGRKPKTSIYTILLVIALVALLIGCLTLWLEIKRHGGYGTVQGRISAFTNPVPIQLVDLATARPPLV